MEPQLSMAIGYALWAMIGFTFIVGPMFMLVGGSMSESPRAQNTLAYVVGTFALVVVLVAAIWGWNKGAGLGVSSPAFFFTQSDQD